MSTYAPRAKVTLDVPAYASDDPTAPTVTIDDIPVEEFKWTRNSPLEADQLSVTIDGRMGGIDPRLLRNARLVFWLWDANFDVFDIDAHRRFAGIVHKSVLNQSEDGSYEVKIDATDYTTLFLESKSATPQLIPEWSDTLESAWRKVCAFTGFYDIEKREIVSSVSALADRMVFKLKDDAKRTRTFGATVHPRFLRIGKPSPPANSNSWAVWQYLCGMIGCISYIDADQVIVTDVETMYEDTGRCSFIRGENITSVEETSDSAIANKAVLLQSWDPITRSQIESVYPVPGDPRIHVRRTTVPKKKVPRAVDETDVANEADRFIVPYITTQAELDIRAKWAYEERSRQELEGTLRTPVMRADDRDGNPVDILSLAAGDAILVRVTDDPETLAALGSQADIFNYLTEVRQYTPTLARLVAQNASRSGKLIPIYHVKALEVTMGDQQFDIEIRYNNVIR